MQRKVILYISTSLDGFIADQKGSVSWIKGNDDHYQSDYGYQAFIDTVDTIVMGYTTYQQIVEELSVDQWPYLNKKVYVITKRKLQNTQEVTFIHEDFVAFLQQLKKQEGKNIWICGGAQIVNQLIQYDVIDEFQITTIPIILGFGIRLFQNPHVYLPLKFVALHEENGIVTQIYQKK